MINGLNTGGFDLQNPEAAAEMTDRVLSMLSQYLLSNQSLQVDETFQVYLKILSIEHMEHQQSKPKRYLFLNFLPKQKSRTRAQHQGPQERQ